MMTQLDTTFDRYADVVRAYREKEREVEKIRSVLTKTQDQAMRKVVYFLIQLMYCR